MNKAPAFFDLARAPRRRLEAVLRAGVTPATESLVGFEWRGFNVPWYTKLVGQKFIKGFELAGSSVEGYNVAVRQNGLMEPWIEMPSPEHPERFGFYVVDAVDPLSVDNRYRDALFLDYAASARNPGRAPERALRSYLIQPDESNADVLLGKAYWAIGRLRWYAAFYILERLRPITRVPDT